MMAYSVRSVHTQG